MPLRENRIAGVRNVRSADRIAAEDDLGMLTRRSALGADQVIATVHLQDVRRLDPNRFLREVDAAVHDHCARTDHLLRANVVLLEPDRAVAVVARRFGGRSVVHDYARPSSSKNIDGSIPSTSRSQIGSDHGPAGFVAVTMKLPPQYEHVVIR